MARYNGTANQYPQDLQDFERGLFPDDDDFMTFENESTLLPARNTEAEFPEPRSGSLTPRAIPRPIPLLDQRSSTTQPPCPSHPDLHLQSVMKHIGDLHRSAEYLLRLVAPDGGNPKDDFKLPRGLLTAPPLDQTEQEQAHFIFRMHVTHYLHPGDKFIEVLRVRQALAEVRPLSISQGLTLDLILYKANLVIFLWEMLSLQPANGHLCDTVEYYDYQFPRAFMDCPIDEWPDLPYMGQSSLLRPAVLLSLNFRIQLIIHSLEDFRVNARSPGRPSLDAQLEAIFGKLDEPLGLNPQRPGNGPPTGHLDFLLANEVDEILADLSALLIRATSPAQACAYARPKYSWRNFMVLVVRFVRLRCNEMHQIARNNGVVDLYYDW